MLHKLFFKYLDDNKIDYCLMNGYENIHECNQNGDIDILIKEFFFDSLENIIKDFCSKNKLSLVQVMKHHTYAAHLFIWDDENNEILNLDIYSKLFRKKWIFSSESEIFMMRRKYHGLDVLSEEHEFFYYLTKKIDKQEYNQNEFVYLKKLYHSKKDKIDKLSKLVYKKPENILCYFKDANPFRRIDRQYYFRHILLPSFCDIKYYFHWQKWFLKRLSTKSGFSIVLLGPDGSGKSTLIDSIFSARAMPFRKIIYFHLKPIGSGLIPIKSDSDYFRPSIKYGILFSYIKLLYLALVYTFGFFINIYPNLLRSNLILFDRYLFDIFIDPDRFGYSGSKKIAAFVSRFIPRPDLILILTAPSPSIHKRKKERSYLELERLQSLYLNFSKEWTSAVMISSKESKKKTFDKAFSIIMKKLSEQAYDKF